MINSKLLGSIGNAVKKAAGAAASGQMGLGQAAKPPMGGSQISDAVKGAIASMPQKIVQQPGFKSMAQVAPRIASGVGNLARNATTMSGPARGISASDLKLAGMMKKGGSASKGRSKKSNW